MRRLIVAIPLLALTALAPPLFAAPLDPPVDCGTRQPTAAQLCQRANGGDVPSQVEFAQQLYAGIAGDPDPETAIAIFRIAAREGNIDALTALAQAYEEGAMGEPDDVAARALYRVAATGGSVAAQASLGDLMVRGLGGPVDVPEGLRLLRDAVEKNDRNAMFLLGSLLGEGIEGAVQKDEAEAARLIRRAAEAGHPAALHVLAANALRANGNLQEAMAFADRAVTASPNNGLYVDTLATLVNRLGDPARALQLYARAVELAPDCSMCIVRYADLLAARNRRNDAVRFYRQAIEANQQSPDPEFNEAQIRQRISPPRR
jgi:TPR repeat protein